MRQRSGSTFRLGFIAFALMWGVVLAREPGSAGAADLLPVVEARIHAALNEFANPMPVSPDGHVVEYWIGVVCEDDSADAPSGREDCVYTELPDEFSQ